MIFSLKSSIASSNDEQVEAEQNRQWLYTFGIGLPRGQIFPFNPKTFINGQNKSTILHGVNMKRPLWLMFSATLTAALLCE